MSELDFENSINRNNQLRNMKEELSGKTGIPMEQFNELFPNQQYLELLIKFEKYLNILNQADLNDLRKTLKDNYSLNGLIRLFNQFNNIDDWRNWVEHIRKAQQNEKTKPLTDHQKSQLKQQAPPIEKFKKMLQKSVTGIGYDIKKIACKGKEFFQETVEEVTKHPLISVGTLLATAALVFTLKNDPNLNINMEITDLEDTLSTALTNAGYGTKNNFFENVQLSVEPKLIIDKLSITKNDQMQLYALYHILSFDDFNAILQELGYGSFKQYITMELGYKDTLDKPAAQKWDEDMSNKLKDFKKNNPDFLRGLYDEWGIYVTEDGKPMFLDNSGPSRGSH